MSVSDLVRPEEISFGDSPVDGNLSGWMDIYQTMVDYQQDNLNAASSENLFFEELSTARDKVQSLTGQPIALSRGESLRTAWVNRYDKLIEQNRLEGKSEWNDVYTSTEAEERARERARQSKIDYDKAKQTAAPGVSVASATIAGSMVGWISDLQNFSATALTAPLSSAAAAGRGIWAVAGIEALTNGLVEAGMQPAIKDWQNKVGHEYTEWDVVTNIAFAGAAGAAFPLFLHGASKTLGQFGVTSEADRAAEALRKQSALNEKPRNLDGAGREAYNENMKEALSAFHEGRAIDPTKIDPRASPKVFADDFVTYEHAAVAKEVVSLGVKKSEIDNAIRKPYIQEKIKELEIDASLARGDLEQIQKELPILKEQVKASRAELKKAKDTLAAQNKAGVSDEASAMKLMVADSEYKKALVSHGELVKRQSDMLNDLSNTTKAIEADDALSKLRNNEIPKSLEKEFSSYKKNVKAAINDINETKYKQDINSLVEAYYSQPLSKADVDAELKVMDSPEYEAGIKKEFDRAVMEEMDGKSVKMVVVDDEGNLKKVTLAELNDELAADMELEKTIKACQI